MLGRFFSDKPLLIAIKYQSITAQIKSCKKLKSAAAVSVNNEPKMMKPTIKIPDVINTGLFTLGNGPSLPTFTSFIR